MVVRLPKQRRGMLRHTSRRADLGYKRDGCHWIGVGEYWLFDPNPAGGSRYGQTLA